MGSALLYNSNLNDWLFLPCGPKSVAPCCSLVLKSVSHDGSSSFTIGEKRVHGASKELFTSIIFLSWNN